MADKFDSFDEDARRTLILAQQEAVRLGHNYIGTEHLLLGIVGVTASPVARMLVSEGANLTRLRAVVIANVGRNSPRLGVISLTPRTKQAIEDAVVEAEALHHASIRPEHLMLGIIREGQGVALRVLASLGVESEPLRAAILRALVPPDKPPSSLVGEQSL